MRMARVNVTVPDDLYRKATKHEAPAVGWRRAVRPSVMVAARDVRLRRSNSFSAQLWRFEGTYAVVASSPPEGIHPIAPGKARPVGSEGWRVPQHATLYSDDARLVLQGGSAQVE